MQGEEKVYDQALQAIADTLCYTVLEAIRLTKVELSSIASFISQRCIVTACNLCDYLLWHLNVETRTFLVSWSVHKVSD